MYVKKKKKILGGGGGGEIKKNHTFYVKKNKIGGGGGQLTRKQPCRTEPMFFIQTNFIQGQIFSDNSFVISTVILNLVCQHPKSGFNTYQTLASPSPLFLHTSPRATLGQSEKQCKVLRVCMKTLNIGVF